MSCWPAPYVPMATGEPAGGKTGRLRAEDVCPEVPGPVGGQWWNGRRIGRFWQFHPKKKLGFSHQEMEVSCHGSAQKWMVYNGKSMGNPIKMEAFGDKNWQAQMRFEGLGKLNIWPIAKAGAPSNYGSQGRQGKGSGSCDGVVSEWGMFFGGFTYFEYTFFKTIYIYNMCACVACVFVGPPKIGKNGRMTSKPLVPHGSTLMTIGFYFHSDYGVW